jgi:CHAT domain-containing protein
MHRPRAWLLTTTLVLGTVPAEALAATLAAPVTNEEAAQAVVDATDAIKAHKAGDFDTAATKGQAALVTLGPMFGWHDETVQLVAGITVDALVKLGRNAEADALIDKVRAAQLAAGPAETKTPAPTPPPQATPDNPEKQAAVKAGEAMLAFIEGRNDAAVDAALVAIELQAGADPNAEILGQYRVLLANLYQGRLQYDLAEDLLRDERTAAEGSGDDARLHGAILSLADLRLARGQVDEAERAFKESDAVAQRLGTPEAEAKTLQGLGEVALARDQPAAAIPSLERAVKLQESRSVVGALHLLSPVSALGRAYEEAGRFDDAERTLLRAEGIAERSFGASGPVVWNVRSNLGRLYRSMKRYDDAITLFDKLLREQEAALPARSPSLGATLNHLAETLWAKGGEARRTVDLASRAAELQEHNITQVVAAGTEEQKRAYLERYVSGTDRIISYHVGYVPTDPRAARLSLNTILRRKGRVLDAVSNRLQAVRDRLDPSDAAALDRLREARGQISALVLRGPDDNLPADAHRETLAALQTEVEQLERTLSSVTEVALSGELIESTAVQAAIPEDAALVEIAVYRPFDVHYRNYASAFGAPHYVAYVLRRSGEPEMIDLGAAAPIDKAVAAMRRALATPRSDVQGVGRNLDRLVMAKIRPALGKTQQVLLSPDGQLNLVPFAAMVDDKGRFLVESREFDYLSSGRDLLRLRTPMSASSSAPVLIGAPDFSATGGTGAPDQASGQRSADMSSQMFSPLPGSEAEVLAIGDKIDDARVWTGLEASERAVKDLSRPVLLHVATHGFFLADPSTAAAGTRGVTYNKSGDNWVPPPKSENPLIRSGLALTGANLRASPDGGDGILTALEVANLDLSATELVVLSACETGVGDVQDGEGVYGLRRALVIAGARSQVISLWQVDDEATRDLMVRYYQRLRRGNGRSEALRATQLHMLHRKATRHPFYWAAFIPSGDWEGMDLNRREPRPRRERADRGGRSGRLRGYWREKFDDPMTFFQGGYSAPLVTQEHTGAAATNTSSFDLRARFFFRPWLFFGLDYGRHPWNSPDSERQLQVAINRFELVGGMDVLPMPYQWRVRPGLHPYLGLGLAWGRQHQLPPPPVAEGTEPERNLMGGAGLTFGTDGALYFRLTDRIALALLGGVAKPIYRLRASGERTDYDKDFPRAWRWQAGVGIGALPR